MNTQEWNDFKSMQQTKQNLKDYTMSVELPIANWFDIDVGLEMFVHLLGNTTDARILQTVSQIKKVQAIIHEKIQKYGEE